MPRSAPRKFLLIALSVLVLIALAGIAGLHFASQALKSEIEAALGAESEIGSITLGLTGVTIEHLKIKALEGWPAAETLRAEKISVSPDWRALLSRQIVVSHIQVDGAYLSVLRTADGKLRLLPSLLEKPKNKSDSVAPAVSIGSVALAKAALDFYDASVARPAHKMRLENVTASVTDIALPTLAERSKVALTGTVKGVHRDGTLAIQGDVVLATREGEIKTTLRGVDLVALQPYLIKASETGVKRGNLDLDITATVKNRRLHAPGVVTLHQLELATQGSFMGFPRQAAVGALKDGKDDIRVKFALEGNLDDPKFSLNENLATRFGAGLADSLGVSIGSLGKTIGTAASGVGGALKGLFSK